MSPRDRQALEAELRDLRAPEEAAARSRTHHAVTLAALRAQQDQETETETQRDSSAAGRLRARLPRDPRPAIVALVAALLAGLMLSPAGASVRGWIQEAIGPEPTTRSVPLKLPAEGSILTVNDGGAWVASQNGSIRRLGDYSQTTFSPRGLNYAVADGRELAAVNAEGDLQWKLLAPGRVADPAWAPSGIRIAYRAGPDLRLIDGDGENDRLFAPNAGAAAGSVWRTDVEGETARDVLAWLGRDGDIRIADVLSSAEPTTIQPAGMVRALTWLTDGRLVVAGDRELAVYSVAGTRESALPLPRGGRVTDIAADPSDQRVALARSTGRAGGGSELLLARVEAGKQRQRVLFSGPGLIVGVAFAPDGSWVGFGWPPADSWLFARPQENTKLLKGIHAAPEISGRFSEGADALLGPGFPEVIDWCC